MHYLRLRRLVAGIQDVYGLVWFRSAVDILKLNVVLVHHECSERIVVASGIAYHLVDNNAPDGQTQGLKTIVECEIRALDEATQRLCVVDGCHLVFLACRDGGARYFYGCASAVGGCLGDAERLASIVLQLEVYRYRLSEFHLSAVHQLQCRLYCLCLCCSCCHHQYGSDNISVFLFAHFLVVMVIGLVLPVYSGLYAHSTMHEPVWYVPSLSTKYSVSTVCLPLDMRSKK